MKIKDKKAKSLAVDSSPLSMDELKKGIADAEKGPFYNPEQSKKLIASWRKKKSSLVESRFYSSRSFASDSAIGNSKLNHYLS
jgi:hypothetical protein